MDTEQCKGSITGRAQTGNMMASSFAITCWIPECGGSISGINAYHGGKKRKKRANPFNAPLEQQGL